MNTLQEEVKDHDEEDDSIPQIQKQAPVSQAPVSQAPCFTSS